MSDTDVIVTAVLALIGLPIFLGLAAFVLRHMRRNHIYVDLDLKGGGTMRKLVAPQQHGTVVIKGGRYILRENAFILYKRRPLFRFKEGDPRPVRYTTKYVLSPNPGSLEKVKTSIAANQTIPAETLETFMKQKLFADAYAGRAAMFLMLGLGLLFVILLILGLYVRK